jgi:hypothetical protein
MYYYKMGIYDNGNIFVNYLKHKKKYIRPFLYKSFHNIKNIVKNNLYCKNSKLNLLAVQFENISLRSYLF